MTALGLIFHLLNFLAPAAVVAALLVILSSVLIPVFRSKRPLALSPWAQVAIVFVASTILLLAGLAIFGRDGKMASYALLVVGAAACQWVLLGDWRA
jgi:hypothetical protein